MNFGFNEEQELLRREVRKFLDEQCPLEVVRQLAQSPSGYSPELWKDSSLSQSWSRSWAASS